MNKSVQKLQKNKQPGAWEGKRILLAEDNEINREFAIFLLESMGFTVDWTENGMEAFERFCQSSKGDYSMILLDIQMPVLDGLEAAKRIRRQNHPDAGHIPILALFAYDLEKSMGEMQGTVIQEYLSKPLDEEELERVMGKYFH